MTTAEGQAREADDVELERYFQALEREDRYRVDEVLKESPTEVTQLVSLVGADGEPQLGWRFVRKFIKRESGMGIAYERIFEAQRAGRRFRHLPRVFECYANDDDMVVVMERVTGETLQEFVERVGPSEALARDVFPQLCDAACELHEGFEPPLIHRDLTPANVVLSEGGTSAGGLALIDFGIAREYRDGAFADTTRFGTRSFAPPEQYGFGQTTVRSDVFALGMVLYFCLTGLVPDTYVDEEDFAAGEVPGALREVIARATALDPVNRFASVRELKAAFSEAGAAGAAAGSCSGGGEAVRERPVASGARGAADLGVRGATGLGARGVVDRVPLGLGIVWDVLLVFVAAVFLVACVAAFGEPGGANADYPTWANVLDYLVFLPPVIVAGAWLLADKRPLQRRFPRLRRFRFWHWLLVFVVVFGCAFLGIGIVSIVAG